MGTSISRREFLKLTGEAALALPFALKPDFSPQGIMAPLYSDSIRAVENFLLAQERTYQLPHGRVPLVNYIVSPGDSIARTAGYFNTRLDLIKEANDLRETGIHPGDTIKVPAFANVPLAYIPEVDIIRHKLEWPYTSSQAIAELYRLDEKAVQAVYNQSQNWFHATDGTYLILRDANVPQITPVEVVYKGGNLLDPEVAKYLINVYSNIVLSKTNGDTSVLSFLQRSVRIEYGAPGFDGTNTIVVQADDIIGEGSVRRQMGHELTHRLPFPWWSTGADEGSAGFVAVEWVTQLHREYGDHSSDYAYDPYFYEAKNKPDLRRINFGDRPVENRILATEAWRRIEKHYPRIFAYLLISGAREVRETEKEPIPTWPVGQVSGWVTERFGPDAWEFIESQHILFTR